MSDKSTCGECGVKERVGDDDAWYCFSCQSGKSKPDDTIYTWEQVRLDWSGGESDAFRRDRLNMLLGILMASLPAIPDVSDLLDHKGTLFVTWSEEPTDFTRGRVVAGWELLNESIVIHVIDGEEVRDDQWHTR